LKGFLYGLFNKTGFDAAGTGLDFYGLTILNTPDALKVGVPPFFGFIVSVADIVTDKRFLATDIAYFGHLNISSLLNILIIRLFSCSFLKYQVLFLVISIFPFDGQGFKSCPIQQVNGAVFGFDETLLVHAIQNSGKGLRDGPQKTCQLPF
jgi:hypothetical protein